MLSLNSQMREARLDGPKHVQSLHGLSVVISSLLSILSSVSKPHLCPLLHAQDNLQSPTIPKPKQPKKEAVAAAPVPSHCCKPATSKAKIRSKGYGMASAGKRPPYVLLLLLALAAAALSVVILHKVRERRAFVVDLQERDRQIVSLRIFLQKEKAINKEMKRKVEELKATTSSLRTQKTDLKTKLKGLEVMATNLKNTQKELEAALTEKDSCINQIEEKAARTNPDHMAALMELLQRKEAELEEIKIRFQDYKITDVTSKSTPVQKNNAKATPDIAVVEKATNSSGAIPATAEVKSSGNTTVTERKHQKDRSLEHKQMKSTNNMEGDGLQDKTSDVVEGIDDIYRQSHSRKSEFPRRDKKIFTNNRVGSQGEELDGIELSGHSLDQDSDRVRYNKLLEKENGKAAYETNNQSNTDGALEKISKESLSDANQNRSKQAVEETAGAADVKPKMSVNDDGTQQQNKRHKKKKYRSKKKMMVDIATINDDGEITKEREVDATSIPE